jgi:hypothetical protein
MTLHFLPEKDDDEDGEEMIVGKSRDFVQAT